MLPQEGRAQIHLKFSLERALTLFSEVGALSFNENFYEKVFIKRELKIKNIKNKNMLKTKTIFTLFSVVVLAFTFSLENVYAATPEFNTHPNDHKTLRLKNRTKGTVNWTTPISADAGDRISFDVYYHNNVEGSVAKNTKVRISFPCDEKSTIIPTAYISADNASTVSDTARINVSSSQKLVFDNVAKWYPDQKTTHTNIPVTQVGPCSLEVDIGDIKGCWDWQGHVVFDATLTEDEEEDPYGELSCYSSTENSVRLDYSFEEGDNVSLFRGNTRIETWIQSNRSGRITDTGLSPDTSYTYYLRNGKHTSSTLLDKVICKTKDDEDPYGELSCYSFTENSIRLSYSFEEGDNVSLFRGNTRLETWTQSNRSGRITDTGLSPDTSYTYYLRNGRFTSSERLARAVCRTSYEEKEEELTVTKRVKSVDRDTVYSTSLNASPGELLNYSIRVTARDGKAEDVFVKDTLPTHLTYAGNLRVDGTRVSGNIGNGIYIGDISAGEYKTVTFDVRIASRDSFLIGTTSMTNVARATSGNDSTTGKATVHVKRTDPVGPPTEVPTGITGNTVLDYIVLPLLLTMLIFILFRKQFVALTKRLEEARKEVRSEW